MLTKKEVFGNADLCDDSGEFTNIQASFELCIEKIVEKNCNCSPTLSDVSLGLWICDLLKHFKNQRLQSSTSKAKRLHCISIGFKDRLKATESPEPFEIVTPSGLISPV
ncbi:Hypothetical predicted protein [Mytilus galloprovincialis]|uniref:Uncharacterized protein n=1 Tax=Mytilus galloprovincialis TaxID=29158 RepID=A0A8B6CIG7_MYTGA|nr:Hypothetical predicted protein [Mytilus galloprovincialis]